MTLQKSLEQESANTRELKRILQEIIAGGSMEAARADFRTKLTTMTFHELTNAAQQLDNELGGGAILIAEKKLKDFLLHELIDAGIVERIGTYPPGHPIQNYLEENALVTNLCNMLDNLTVHADNLLELTNLFNQLAEVQIHYVRKENQLFPYLEKAGFSHPSTAMWQFHEDIRQIIKESRAALEAKDCAKLSERLPVLTREIREMILREEMILLPVSTRFIDEPTWGKIRSGEEEVGYMGGIQPPQWEPAISGYLQHSEERMAAMVAISKGFIDGDLDANAAKQKIQEQLKKITGGEFAFAEVELEKMGVSQHSLQRKIEELVAIYKDALGDDELEEVTAGHPVHTLRKENRAIKKLVEQIKEQSAREPLDTAWLTDAYSRLMQVTTHYARKENQLFPYLEKKNFTTPSTIMWTLHDDIRANLKYHKSLVDEGHFTDLLATQESLLSSILEMIFKEEKILYPVCLELITPKEWVEIRQGEDEIGYCLIPDPIAWPDAADAGYRHPSQLGSESVEKVLTEGLIGLDEGLLTQEQIKLIFSFLPIDVTYTDENDIVRFYNKGDYRIFPRSPGIIGREVRYCHPPKSVDTVMEIISAFRSGERDVAEFWIQLKGQFIHIRFFALRDKENKYKGVLEIMQEVSEIRALEGNRTLLNWE